MPERGVAPPVLCALPARTRFQGLAQVWRFNRHLYVVGLALVAAAALVLVFVRPSGALAAAAWLALVVSGWWTLASLGASHYVYDRSALWRWSWIEGLFARPPRRWLLLHAGLDESSAALRELFPHADARVVDVYDPRTMSEPSLRQARAELGAASAIVARQARLDALELPDGDRDAVFLILAAHELRPPEDRRRMFRELARVLAPGGRILLVEHLRDAANFLVYGPGAFHFHARGEWLAAAAEAELALVAERRVNAFVRAFVFERAGAARG